jgi:hypothetical protein
VTQAAAFFQGLGVFEERALRDIARVAPPARDHQYIAYLVRLTHDSDVLAVEAAAAVRARGINAAKPYLSRRDSITATVSRRVALNGGFTYCPSPK